MHLSAEEVREYLASNGADEVIVLPLKQPIDTSVKHFVIGSASSTRLIRRLLETIVDVVSQSLSCG